MEIWQFARNTFLALTATSHKRMHILLTDHFTRLGAMPGDSDFMAMVSRTTTVMSDWDTAYTAWISSKVTYKGRTHHWQTKLADLSSLRIKQWDIAIQGVFLEGTAEYTMLLPNGRSPFQKGAYDQRLVEVKALQNRLLAMTPAVPALTTLAATIGTYHTEMVNLRDAQQAAEGLVDHLSSNVEAQRKLAAAMMYKNLGRLMEKYSDTPVRVEDFYDMNYIRKSPAARSLR